MYSGIFIFLAVLMMNVIAIIMNNACHKKVVSSIAFVRNVARFAGSIFILTVVPAYSDVGMSLCMNAWNTKRPVRYPPAVIPVLYSVSFVFWYVVNALSVMIAVSAGRIPEDA